MNYAVAVFAVVLGLCLGSWGVKGRRFYSGPRTGLQESKNFSTVSLGLGVAALSIGMFAERTAHAGDDEDRCLRDGLDRAESARLGREGIALREQRSR